MAIINTNLNPWLRRYFAKPCTDDMRQMLDDLGVPDPMDKMLADIKLSLAAHALFLTMIGAERPDVVLHLATRESTKAGPIQFDWRKLQHTIRLL